ncbi:MAG: hypothetical protein CMF60_07765 [Magnetococcales bacterium]|nr:hypothetical protein [Magnetococcales bacterium]|tara:strand:+ start:5103 stop:5648 length:546 start_codon:yes stop_codon:yes gene_type:complete
MKNQITMGLLGVTVALLTTTANATELKPYVGLDVSGVSFEMDSDVSAVLPDRYTAVSPYVGVELSDKFAIEGGYIKSSEESKNVGANQVRLKFSGFYLDAVGKYAVNEKIDLLGSVGLQRTKAEVEVLPAGTTGDDTAIDLRIGGGAEYALNDKVGLRANLRYINYEDGALQYGVGVNYKF